MNRIVSDIDICGGRPRIEGTRIRIIDILEMLSNKLTFDQIIDEFPELKEDDIKSAIEYAEKRIEHATIS
jgi:uncharacterized protein (DUF433 family)